MTIQRESRSGRPRPWRVAAVPCAMLAAFALALAASPAPPPAPQAASPTPRVMVRFQAEATATNGATGVWRASQGPNASVGERATAWLAAGTATEPNLCHLRGDADGKVGSAFVSWQLSATVLDVEGPTVRLSVEWIRTGLAPIGSAASTGAPDIRLRPGQAHVLDAVIGPPGPAGGCSNVLVSVAVDFPATDALLGYHIALVHERAGVRTAPLPVDLVGRVREAVPFRFRPLRWPIGAGTAPDASPAVEMDVLGTVAGTLADGGAVNVFLTAIRSLVFGGSSAGSGSMNFVANPGEEIAVELPRPTARSSKPWAAASRLGPFVAGVEAEGDWLRTQYATFFAGDRTSLVIRVDRLR